MRVKNDTAEIDSVRLRSNDDAPVPVAEPPPGVGPSARRPLSRTGRGDASERSPDTSHVLHSSVREDYTDAFFSPTEKYFFQCILLLTEENLSTRSYLNEDEVYDKIIEAIESDSKAERHRLEFSRIRFHLYERTDSAEKWRRAAVLATSSSRSLDSAEEWAHIVEWANVTAALDGWSAGAAEPEETGGAAALSAGAACGALALASGAALVGRWLARRRRRRRRREDAVLAPADFTFPVDERRRVGEGMETMLSCWLQQLHEFGGPELERPDLLKQPPRAAPRAPSAPSSTCSVNRVTVDRRIRYKGDVVHVKYLPGTAALELKRKATDVLLVMQNLRHENLNPFIGCLCEARAALVFDHCLRGSLEDVLMADDIKLDWTFRLSLLTDLVKGMRYLHSSPLRVHGRLSSRNCVVDSRWVLRLTDYGLPALYRAQAMPLPHRTARDLLWTAPELLREGRGEARGTQPGDVFSFAIIMQEVIVRGEPYCMLSLTPDEIVEKVSRPPPLIRPSVSMGAAPPEAVSVMRQCWSEAPDLRPDFHRLHDIFRHLHRGRKINIVDSMFEMLEKYSNNLEELIRERTEQLDMEKKKTEQLLNRMLPRSVAERLLLGSRVEPEEFEEVSIYFSDIVGFTALAARSTPVQVVDLLNDLYTTFDAAIEQYRVYKVETIGDAYMVVGGLPTRTRDHAESVATMALHLLHLAGRFRVRHLPDTPLHLRIGLHTGPCCAAVVGLTMPRYCLFGDTVNTASRMESTGAAWRVQVSATTAERLSAAGGYRLRSRGLTQIKGKGAMHTYWLLGKDGFDKPLPTPPPLESEEVLFETDGENESESSSAPTSTPARRSPGVERQISDPPETSDDQAWQRSGAVSADSSPPRAPRAVHAAASVDHSAHYSRYRCLGNGRRALRRQWSLERGDALAAAAAGGAGPSVSAPPSPPEPLALLASSAPAPRVLARYRTRPERDAPP
ncbi:retinal guanylyl cyclase 1 [Anticarsia gemmatalis]|uniref:retinal guanylyl cyclase 1 n=1 Tax=Anticarsia gemmatalis TaxID=129554 RepID=UPI003F76745B